jgi:hypothetical protein
MAHLYGSISDDSEAEVRAMIDSILAESDDDDDDSDDENVLPRRRPVLNNVDTEQVPATTTTTTTTTVAAVSSSSNEGSEEPTSAQDRVWKYKELVAIVLSIMVVMLGATIFYFVEEHQTFGNSIYFTIITLTTIGMRHWLVCVHSLAQTTTQIKIQITLTTSNDDYTMFV